VLRKKEERKGLGSDFYECSTTVKMSLPRDAIFVESTLMATSTVPRLPGAGHLSKRTLKKYCQTFMLHFLFQRPVS
jgi:hypothetical protein